MKHLIQNTPEWLEMRRSKVGASDAPIIMGESPWKTIHQLWLEKTGLKTSSKQTVAMKRGKDLEEKARVSFEEETGYSVKPEVLFHKDYDWMMASFDGINLELGIVVEIKCPGPLDHESALQGIIPSKYYAQLQHQMAVSDLDKIYYYSFDGILGTTLELDRDEEYILKMIKKEENFISCVFNFLPPQ